MRTRFRTSWPGSTRGSGDENPIDSAHGTFFQLLYGHAAEGPAAAISYPTSNDAFLGYLEFLVRF